MNEPFWAAAATALLLLSGCNSEGGQGSSGTTRNQIRIVGSSTVYPFTTAVAEQFARKYPNFQAPIVESTGTGAGFKLFCAGVGAQHPDIEDASRKVEPGELESCRQNGIRNLIELQIGIDGIAFTQSPDSPRMSLTDQEIYEAIAATPYGKPQTKHKWKEINPSLPDIPILLYGPPPTSGTRDAFAELILTKGCLKNPDMKALKDSNPDQFKTICTKVREDPNSYVESGENDNLIAQKVTVNPGAIGIFGYSYLEENKDKLRAVPINGVEPTRDAITSFKYEGARPLFIYVKGEHLNVIPGLKQFLAEYSGSIGPDSYLVRRGLIVAPEDVRKQTAQTVANLGATGGPAAAGK